MKLCEVTIHLKRLSDHQVKRVTDSLKKFELYYEKPDDRNRIIFKVAPETESLVRRAMYSLERYGLEIRESLHTDEIWDLSVMEWIGGIRTLVSGDFQVRHKNRIFNYRSADEYRADTPVSRLQEITKWTT